MCEVACDGFDPPRGCSQVGLLCRSPCCDVVHYVAGFNRYVEGVLGGDTIQFDSKLLVVNPRHARAFRTPVSYCSEYCLGVRDESLRSGAVSSYNDWATVLRIEHACNANIRVLGYPPYLGVDTFHQHLAGMLAAAGDQVVDDEVSGGVTVQWVVIGSVARLPRRGRLAGFSVRCRFMLCRNRCRCWRDRRALS